VKVAFVLREVMPEGGLTLASFRLATALAEGGDEAEVLYRQGDPPPDLAAVGRRIEQPLRRALEGVGPDVVLVGSGELDDMLGAAAVAPTVVHAHVHHGVCPDEARYWSRLRQPCTVRAGRRCSLLRPALGCSDLRQSLRQGPVAAQRQILDAIAAGPLGVVCVSTDQGELFARHGVPPSRLAVLPNLGIRAAPAELEAASRGTPEAWRDAIAFFGRLSKPKGGELLGQISRALPPELRFRVFGDGYLAGRLARSLPPGVMCGHVPQHAVTGVMMWARAAIFPSLWPEPGGIVGVDAQVMGVPLAAFDLGAPRHWPAARRFPRGEAGAMAAWLAGREGRTERRDPEAIAAAQRGYWERIAARGAELLSGFAANGSFEQLDDAPAEELILAP
jgi:glycosyltransferase involved in cell wall biosynthesis